MLITCNKLKIYLGVLFGCVVLSACDVVPLDSAGKPIIPMSEEEAASFKNMEPKAIADKVWPNLVEDAKSSAKSFDELNADMQNDTSYFVTLSGVVDGIEEKSNMLTLNLRVKDSIIPVQFGTIVRGNALRDATPLISFDQFKNQTQFARISKELNKKALAGVTKPAADWTGKTLEILTALTVKNHQVQDVVPIEIKISD